MKQLLPVIAVILILGVALISFALISLGQEKATVVGFFGPFPIGAGNDLDIVKLAMILAGISFIAYALISWLLPRLKR